MADGVPLSHREKADPWEAPSQVAFDALMSRHGPGLARVARAYSRSEADDLLQEISLAIWQALPNFRRECSERTFVFRVAHNRAWTFSERRRARPTHELDESIPATGDPESSLAEARRRDALWDGIRALAPPARMVLTLALEGLSHDEIGEVLGVSAGSVAVRLSRARAQLREWMQGGTR
jgi:RNA polymerase sigma-70 factor (ECF subfamily)